MKNSGDFVTAYRGDQTKRFTRRSWDVMGTDKYGWSLVPEVPKEVAEIVNAEDVSAKEPLVIEEEDDSVTFPMSASDEQAEQIKGEIAVIQKRRKK